MKKLILLILSFIGFIPLGVAQDYTFANHNIVPFSINPAFVGNANAIRLGLNYRMQWPTLGNNYHTIRASYDMNFYKKMCSLGLSFAHDNMANGTIKTNEIALAYGHNISLSEKMSIRLGVQASLFINSYGPGVTFGDQYDWGTGDIFSNTTEDYENAGITFADFSAGVLYSIHNLLNLGFSVYHLGEPENGILAESDNTLHRKFVVHGNFYQDLQSSNGLWGREDLSDRYLFVNAAFQSQYNFMQGYLGTGIILSPLIGGIALKSDFDNINNIAFMVGATIKNFQIYYVYDLFTSKKKNGSWSQELSLIYVINRKEKFPCPVVYW